MKSTGSVVIQAKVSFIAGFGTIQSSFTPFISVPPCGGSAGVIKHIVFIIKENRTFDNYFGTFGGANGATSGVTSTGITVKLTHETDRLPRDIAHSWDPTVWAMDGGKMDQFDTINGGNKNGDLAAYT